MTTLQDVRLMCGHCIYIFLTSQFLYANVRFMEKSTDTPKKRGRKPLGDRPMTQAEAKRRSREKMRAAGVKDYLMTVGPSHLIWIKRLAEQHDISEAAALHMVLDNALDYFSTVMMCHLGMHVLGSSQEECSRYVLAHWPLATPPVPEALRQPIDAA